MKKQIKPLTLISGIATLLCGIILAGFSFYFFVSTVSEQTPETVFFSLGLSVLIVGFLAFIIFGFAVSFISCGIIQIVLATKTNKEFLAKQGAIITFLVFDGILIVLELLLVVGTLSTSNGIVISLSLFFLQIVSFVLKLVDICIFKHRVATGKIEIEKDVPMFFASPENKIDPSSFAGRTPNIQISAPAKKEFVLEDEIKNLDSLKEKKLITEEEYQKLKQELINKTLNI